VGWLLPYLPIDPSTVHGVHLFFQVACVLGIVGLASRVAFAVIALTASYLLLVPQLGGAVFHDHHLLWLAVIVAASPVRRRALGRRVAREEKRCAAAFTWRGPRRGGARGVGGDRPWCSSSPASTSSPSRAWPGR
jgi:hypothetical protein